MRGLTMKSTLNEEKETRGDRTERLDSNSNCQEPRPFAERVASWNIVKLNDYIQSEVGTKQQYLKEDFVMKVMMVSIQSNVCRDLSQFHVKAVKDKEIDMKGAAELLGVSYSTLYGKYTASFGSLKQNVKTPVKVNPANTSSTGSNNTSFRFS